ncbi:MAG: thioredoxin domain-containing protein [Myxococcales bacterium]|nr:thioredoxin domain-containing protein [Myxococcales bacterium]
MPDCKPADAVPPHENRLKDETSPYLRQHMHNPVDWLPWGGDAFALAQRLDRPILLSIGYSACHWCHVMAHESFEDAETAAQMNRDFVNIKVDREEHPDVDQLYQHALQLFGQGGGWPLTMFLLPTGEPFYGGTYFPPHEAYGRPSFRRVMDAVRSAYKTDRERLQSQARQVVEALREFEGRAATESGALGNAVLGLTDDENREHRTDVLQQALERLGPRIDRLRGGFSGAPKFPNPTALSLFVRGYGRSRDRQVAEPALLTLGKMAAGGIYDHLGGGFARYSTDAEWLVPHFEKMLYDNAQLLRLFAEAHAIHLAHGEARAAARCAEVVAETHAWLERELTDAQGGLYAAQDADSEGVEGKFFVWTPEQIEAVLPVEHARLFARCYDVKPGGNWQDPHGHAPGGASILHVVHSPENDEERALLQDARSRLLRARSERTWPGTDDKVLTGWNGLAMTGLAEAGRLLSVPRYVRSARRIADFIERAMWDEARGLLRTYKLGQAKLPATLDDHAFLAEGLIHLAFASQDLGYLRRAMQITDALLDRFYDPERGLFYLGPEASAGVRLPVRPVSFHDGAIPSGVSVACMNLIRLAGLFDFEKEGQSERSDVADRRQRYLQIASQTLQAGLQAAQRGPVGLSNWIAALDLLRHGLTVTVIVDPKRSYEGTLGEQGQALVAAAHGCYVPDHAVLVCHPEQPLPDGLDHHRRGTSGALAGAVAYVCHGPVCSAPLQDPTSLRARLSESSR